MAKTLEQWQEIAQLSQELGDVDAELEAREGIALLQSQPQDEQSFGEAADETLRTIAQNALAETASGFAGLFELGKSKIMTGEADFDAASDAVADFQEQFSYVPSERSQAQLQDIGAVVEGVTDVVNVPLSGLAGLGELATGQGIDQASKTVENIQDNGLGTTLGDRALEEGASPAVATAVSMIPEVVESAATMGGALATRGARQASKEAIKQGASMIAEETPEAIARGAQAVKKFSIPQSARKQEIGRLLSEEADVSMPRDISTVGFDLVNPVEAPLKKPGNSLSVIDESGISYPVEMDGLEDIADVVDTPVSAADEVVDIIETDRFKVKNNRFDKSAQKHGFSNGMISFIKGANQATTAKLKRMTELRQKARNSGDVGVTERPSDIVGDSVLERIKFLDNKPVYNKKGEITNMDELGVKQKAGIQLEKEVDRLPDQVDYSQPLLNFKQSMEKNGVEFTSDGINWDSSVFSNDTRSQKAIIDTLRRFSRPTTLSGKDLHNSKLWLDQTMDVGKIGGDKPLSDRVQRSLLRLRTDVNQTLRDVSPGYKRANVAFSDAIQAVDNFDKSMGHSIDVQNIDEFTKAGVGTKLRTVFSNQAGRANMSRALQDLDESVKKYGGEFDDNVLILNSMATELDRRFGNIAPQSFGGQISSSIKQGSDFADRPIATTIDKAAKKADELFKTEEKAFQSMNDLLNQ
jgi:hypothetical protein